MRSSSSTLFLLASLIKSAGALVVFVVTRVECAFQQVSIKPNDGVLRMRNSCHHPLSTKKVCPLFLSSIDASNPETKTGGDRTSGSESNDSIILDNEHKQQPESLTSSSSSEELFRLAPPLTFEKFLTMQVNNYFLVGVCECLCASTQK